MNLHLHFILINSEFNQALADDLYQGEESEDNIKYLWEDELKVSADVTNFKIRNRASYTLAGQFANGENFNFEIGDMTIVDCTTIDNTTMQFAVSKKLVKNTEKIVDDKNNETHMYFYLKDAFPLENPMDGVYILKSDFPKELKSTKKA